MSTCKIAILIASHINNVKRITYLKTCLDSLLNQTCTCDIYVSISCSHRWKKIDNVIEKYTKMNIHFLISDSIKSQFQHFHNLLPLVMSYDLLMFCDDDDTYDINRVDIFKKQYMNKVDNGKIYVITDSHITKRTNVEHDKSKYLQYVDKSDQIYDLMVKNGSSYEYVNNAIHPKILSLFFDEIDEYNFIESCNYCDVVFRNYLACIQKNKVTFSANVTLYNYNYVDDSVCSKLDKFISSIVCYCTNDVTFMKKIDEYYTTNMDQFVKNIYSQMFICAANFRKINLIYHDNDSLKNFLIKIFPTFETEFYEMKDIFLSIYESTKQIY